MYNKVILIGNLTKDPEVRFSTGGMPIATMSIAVNTRYKQNDETKDETLFIDGTVFGKMAEICGQNLSKGKRVLIEGRLRRRRWEKDGQKFNKIEIVISSVKFLSPREESSDLNDSHKRGEPF